MTKYILVNFFIYISFYLYHKLYFKLHSIIIKELFLIIIANTLHCNIATTLQYNLVEGGHFYDTMILHQCCKYIAQSICNITKLQRNIFAIILQSFCAVWVCR